MEYGYNLADPVTGNVVYQPGFALSPESPDTVSFQFRRNVNAEDVEFTIEHSTSLNLNDWAPVVYSSDQITVSAIDAETHLITVELPFTDETNFYRLSLHLLTH